MHCCQIYHDFKGGDSHCKLGKEYFTAVYANNTLLNEILKLFIYHTFYHSPSLTLPVLKQSIFGPTM